MQAIEAKLRAGLAENGILGEQADEVVRGITSFALYGFPESHAASFALLAYASAYLKAHHPEAFLCALLNAWPMGFYHPATLVKDAERHGVRVLPIDVVHSDWRCTIEPPAHVAAAPEAGRTDDGPGRARCAVRLGLSFVRGLHEDGGRRLTDARREAPFRDVGDLARRSGLARRDLVALAELGALGTLVREGRRAALWQVSGLAPSREALLAGVAPLPARSRPRDMSALERTLADYRTSGLTTGPHLVAHLRPALRRERVVPLARLAGLENGAWVRTAGLVIVRQRPGTAP